MRVIIDGYVGKRKTGIGRVLENILVNLPLRGQLSDEAIVYCNENFHGFDLSTFGAQIKIRRYRISKKSSLLNLIWHQFVYPFKTLLNRADVSYIPNVTLLLVKFRPTVVVIHDLIEFNIPKKFSHLRMLYRKVAVPITARRADRIITVSENSKSDIIKFLKIKPDKIDVVYNGIDARFKLLDQYSIKRIKNKYGLPDRYILFVGTIDHPGKNIYSLIHACRKIWEKEKDGFGLVLVGQKGFGYDVIDRTIKKYNLAEHILHLGYVEDEDLPAVYNGAFLFCFLSLYEGFGLPVIEAMASGVPVIVSDRSCLPEIVGDAGVVVEADNIEETSKRIYELVMDEKKRHVLKEKGLKRARLFSWEKAARETYKVLEGVVITRKK